VERRLQRRRSSTGNSADSARCCATSATQRVDVSDGAIKRHCAVTATAAVELASRLSINRYQQDWYGRD
jgi:hypothetical protein